MSDSPASNLSGHLLIAVPELADPNFFRTVVFLFQHSEQGAAGLVLNRQLPVSIGDAWKQLVGEETESKEPIYFGGPVEGPIMALHTSLAAAEASVIPGVFFSMQRDNISKLLNQHKQSYRIFSGYAGWGAGQLEHELEAGGWLSMPAQANHVFEPEPELWRSVCDQFGREVIFSEAASPRMPTDPQMN